MRLHGPRDDLTRLTLRQHAAQHKPAILCQHTSVVQFQLSIIATDANHALWGFRSHCDAMACLDGARVYELLGTTIVVSLETLKLTGLLVVRTSDGLTGGIAWESVQTTVHRKRLQPVLRWQKFQIEASFTSQFLGYRFVEPYSNLDGLAFSCYHNTTIEILIKTSSSTTQSSGIVAHRYFDASFLMVYLTICHLWYQIPLFWCLVQSDGAALNGAYTVVDDLDARVLLVIESTVETVAEHQHVHTLTVEIFKVVQF